MISKFGSKILQIILWKEVLHNIHTDSHHMEVMGALRVFRISLNTFWFWKFQKQNYFSLGQFTLRDHGFLMKYWARGKGWGRGATAVQQTDNQASKLPHSWSIESKSSRSLRAKSNCNTNQFGNQRMVGRRIYTQLLAVIMSTTVNTPTVKPKYTIYHVVQKCGKVLWNRGQVPSIFCTMY